MTTPIWDILFSLYNDNGTLNYYNSVLKTTFNANIHAANSAADNIMDYFMASWNDDIRAGMAYSIEKALCEPNIKARITGGLMTVLRQNLPNNRVISKIEFSQDAIKVTNH